MEKVIKKSLHLKLEPNLRPGETGILICYALFKFYLVIHAIDGLKGAHYVICTHSGAKQPGNCAKSDLNIEIQIVGEKGRTRFIGLQHSQLNKQPFVPGKKDIFDVFATDVGKVNLNRSVLNIFCI